MRKILPICIMLLIFSCQTVEDHNVIGISNKIIHKKGLYQELVEKDIFYKEFSDDREYKKESLKTGINKMPYPSSYDLSEENKTQIISIKLINQEDTIISTYFKVAEELENSFIFESLEDGEE